MATLLHLHHSYLCTTHDPRHNRSPWSHCCSLLKTKYLKLKYTTVPNLATATIISGTVCVKTQNRNDHPVANNTTALLLECGPYRTHHTTHLSSTNETTLGKSEGQHRRQCPPCAGNPLPWRARNVRVNHCRQDFGVAQVRLAGSWTRIRDASTQDTTGLNCE